MRIRILALLAALCFLGSVATAIAGPGDLSEPGPTSCNFDTYAAIEHSPNVAIPDGSALVLGPISFSHQSGTTIQDVIVGLKIEHPSIGDLTVELMRVHELDVQSVQLLDRPGFPESSPGGCQAELASPNPNAVWHFGDDGTNPMADGAGCLPDGQSIPVGCYQVAPESAWNLALFDGLEIGGSAHDPAFWYLIVKDDRIGNVGHVRGWSVHLLDQPTVSTEERSWGVVKARYR